jgi:tetratricopeptide (TPR) repeat protein
MLMQLEARFEFLVSRRRDIAPRHRSLRAAIGWSCELLSPDLRQFFERLSVFQGRWTLEAAEFVCGEGAPVLEHLTELRERSLILTTGGDDEMGYRMLETLREYAAEQLAAEDRAVLRQQHAEYYLALAEQAAAHLQGHDQMTWLDRLEADHDNFRAVLAWSLEEESGVLSAEALGAGKQERSTPHPNTQHSAPSTPERLMIGLRLAGLLYFFWNVRGHIVEGRQWLDQLLALSAGPEPTAARGAALFGAAGLAGTQRDLEVACSLYQESLAVWQAVGDQTRLADTLCQWGHILVQMGNRAAARTLFEESREICRDLGDQGRLAHALKCIGADLLTQGDAEQALVLFEESLSIYREQGDPRGMAMMVSEMAHLALSRAEDERATTLLQEHLELARQLKDPAHAAMAFKNLGLVARHREDHTAARALFEESLALHRELGTRSEVAELLAFLCSTAQLQRDPAAARKYLTACLAALRAADDRRWIAACLELLAQVAVGQPESRPEPRSEFLRVTRLLGAAQGLRGSGDAALWWPAERAAWEQCMTAVRESLGDPAFSSALAEGAAMTVEQALNEAGQISLEA